MRVIAITLFFVLTTIALPLAAAGEDYDVRSVRWFMSKEEVRASEDMDPIKEELKRLTYRDYIFERVCFIGYVFNQDGNLIEASYLFEAKSQSDAKMLYDKIGKNLDGKYRNKNADPQILALNEYLKDMVRHYETDRSVITMLPQKNKAFLIYTEKSAYKEKTKAIDNSIKYRINKENNEMEQF